MRVLPLILILTLLGAIAVGISMRSRSINQARPSSDLRMVGADGKDSSDSAELIAEEPTQTVIDISLTPVPSISVPAANITSGPSISTPTVSPDPSVPPEPIIALTSITPSPSLTTAPMLVMTATVTPTQTLTPTLTSTPTIPPQPKDHGCAPAKPTDLQLNINKKQLSWTGAGGCSGGAVTYAVRIDSRSESDYNYDYRMNGGCTDFKNQAWNSSAKTSWDVCYTQVGAEEISKYDFNSSEGYDIWINATCAVTPPAGCKNYSESVNVKFAPK